MPNVKEGKTDFGKLLEQVAVRDTGISRARGGYKIPAELVEAILKKIKDVGGAIFIPKTWLEEQIGMDTSRPIKGRPNNIKKKLNRNFGDLIASDEIWHVGKRSATDKYPEGGYAISIRKTSEKEAQAWKRGEK